MSCHLAAHSQIIGRLTFVPQANPSKQEPGQGYRLCNQKMTKSNNKNEGHCRSVVPIINKINHKKILVCIYVLCCDIVALSRYFEIGTQVFFSLSELWFPNGFKGSRNICKYTFYCFSLYNVQQSLFLCTLEIFSTFKIDN